MRRIPRPLLVLALGALAGCTGEAELLLEEGPPPAEPAKKPTVLESLKEYLPKLPLR